MGYQPSSSFSFPPLFRSKSFPNTILSPLSLSLSRESVYPSPAWDFPSENTPLAANVSSPHAPPPQQHTTIESRIIKTGEAVILEREEREKRGVVSWNSNSISRGLALCSTLSLPNRRENEPSAGHERDVKLEDVKLVSSEENRDLSLSLSLYEQFRPIPLFSFFTIGNSCSTIYPSKSVTLAIFFLAG